MSTSQSPILVINNGSSSLKFSVLDPKSETVLSSGLAERIGTEQGVLKLSDLEKVKHEEKLPLADHRSALLRAIEMLSKKGRFDCKAIGHRVVHGGEYFRQPELVTDAVIGKTRDSSTSAQSGSRARHSSGCGAFPGQTAGCRVRYRVSPDVTAMRFSLCDSLRVLRKVPNPQVRFPRHQSSLRDVGSRQAIGQTI